MAPVQKGAQALSQALSPISEASSEDTAVPPFRLTHASSSRAWETGHLDAGSGPLPTLDSIVHTNVNDILNTVNANSSNGEDEHHLDHVSAARSLDKLIRPSGYRPFDGRDILDLIDLDERPIFVIDLNDALNNSGNLNVIFANRSLKKHTQSLKMIMGQFEPSDPKDIGVRFTRWVTRIPSRQDACDTPREAILFADFKWTSSVLQRTLKVCRGYTEAQKPFSPRSQPPSPSIRSVQHTPKENARTPTRERGEYFGPFELRGDRHTRSLSSEQKWREKQGQSVVEHKTPPRRERSMSGSKKSKLPLAEPRAPDSPPLSAAMLAAFTDVYDTSSDDEDEPARCFDWTQMSNVAHLSSHIQFIKNRSWELTELGPMNGWSSELKCAVNLVVASPHPAALYWGESLTILYNEAYVNLAGSKHPTLLGNKYATAWSEIWDHIKPIMNSVLYEGKITSKQCDRLFLMRSGTRLEECYFDWAIIPVLAKDGSVAGVYNPAFEQTRQVISERQTKMLRAVSEHTANVQASTNFWAGVIEGIKTNPYDIPFAALYSVSQDVDSDSPQSSIHSFGEISMIVTLQDHVGIPEGHSMLTTSYMDLAQSNSPTAVLMRAAIKNKGPLYRSVDDNSLPPAFLRGITCGVWDDDDCRAIVVCPIFVAQRDQPLGFLITGVSSRRPYNDEYHHYMNQLDRQIETSLASVILVEDEIAKGRKAARAAAREKSLLNEQLQITTNQAAENQAQFYTLTDLNPTGLFIADADGKMEYGNRSFYEFMGVTEVDSKAGGWSKNIIAGDRAVVARLWEQLCRDQIDLDVEIRLDLPWTTPSGTIGEAWAVIKGRRQVADGRLKGILGCIIDVSQQKWAEFAEKERKREALVRKQEQEHFIDMTSHEMRNPLSSILQCAEEIVSIVAQIINAPNLTDAQRKMILELSLIANTLSLCGLHEKRIVDDILTLSKMEAGKLKVSPESVDPKEMVDVARTMFKYDIKHYDIELVVKVDKSYDDLGVKWVNVDPSRVLAVLVNLTTNSIKFTAKEKFRQITITLGASMEPAKGYGSVIFVPTQNTYQDYTQGSAWGDGEAVYLHYSVSDTGKGLNKTELNNLFKRFSQATESTHVAYGGSGLGLFIARLLSEIHGGQIGVASNPGKGSTFSFYVKGKRTTTAPTSHLKAELVKPKGQLNVLLVEDNTIVATTAARSLKSNGCNVHLAEDGVVCLEMLDKSQFRANRDAKDSDNIKVDVILMDQQMPRMDGLECARQIRAKTKEGHYTSHIPIIGTTANARAEQLELVVAAGMDTIVTKPFTMAELFPKIAELMAKHPNTGC